MYQGLQVGYGLAITKDCEDPVRAIKFLDYLCSDEGAVLYKWGVEGENYFVDENGMRYRTEEEIAKAVLIRITEKILVLAIIRDFRFMETVQWMKMVILTHLLRENL